MRAARLLITPVFLQEVLHLPATAMLSGSVDNSIFVEVIVEDESFPDSPADALPTVTPIYERREPVIFVDWGLSQ